MRVFAAICLAVMLAGCGGNAPVSPPPPGPGITGMMGTACLAPMQPGEPDPALRDVRLIRISPVLISFKGCIASARTEGWGPVDVQISVLARDMQQDCMVPHVDGPPTPTGCKGGDGRDLLVALRPAPAGAPAVLGLFSRESPVAAGFGPDLYPMAIAKLTATPCINGNCTAGPAQVSYQLVPVSP